MVAVSLKTSSSVHNHWNSRRESSSGGDGGFFSSISSRRHHFGSDESARTMVAVGFEIGAPPPPLKMEEPGTATMTTRAVEGEGTFSSSSSSSYSSSSWDSSSNFLDLHFGKLHYLCCTSRSVPSSGYQRSICKLSLWLWLPSYALEDLYQWTHKKFLVTEESKSQRRSGSSRATSSPQILGKNIISLLSIELTKYFRILETKLLWIDKKF